jgi:hypothetical protein
LYRKEKKLRIIYPEASKFGLEVLELLGQLFLLLLPQLGALDSGLKKTI